MSKDEHSLIPPILHRSLVCMLRTILCSETTVQWKKNKPSSILIQGWTRGLHSVARSTPWRIQIGATKDFSASIMYLDIANCGKAQYVCDLQHIFEFKVTDFDIAIEGAEE